MKCPIVETLEHIVASPFRRALAGIDGRHPYLLTWRDTHSLLGCKDSRLEACISTMTLSVLSWTRVHV